MKHKYDFRVLGPTPLVDLWGGIQLFQNMAMLHIKLNGIKKSSSMDANILPTDPPISPNPGGIVRI